MKVGSDIPPTLLLAGTLVVSSALLTGGERHHRSNADSADRNGHGTPIVETADDARRWLRGGLRLVPFRIFTQTSPDQEWQELAIVDAKKTTSR